MITPEELQRTRDLAAAYLSYSDRTVSQVRGRLAKKGCSSEAIDAVVADLEKDRILDDSAYARRWVVYGLDRRPAGAAKFAQDLKRRGIDGEIIESILTEFADEVGSNQAALELLNRRHGHYAGLDRTVARRRMRDLLLRRGFDEDTVRQAVSEALDLMIAERVNESS